MKNKPAHDPQRRLVNKAPNGGFCKRRSVRPPRKTQAPGLLVNHNVGAMRPERFYFLANTFAVPVFLVSNDTTIKTRKPSGTVIIAGWLKGTMAFAAASAGAKW